jgi:hypothetical protein
MESVKPLKLMKSKGNVEYSLGIIDLTSYFRLDA